MVLLLFIAGSSITRAAQGGTGDREGFALVLFPVKVITPWGEGYLRRTEILVIEGVAEAVADDALMNLTYTYLKTGDTADAVLLHEVVDSKNIDVWRKLSLMSNFSPDWPRVKTIGAEIDADIAILIRVRKDDNSLVDIYLYDYRQGKIHSRTSKGVYWGSLATGIEKVTDALIQDFYDNQ